MARAYWLMKSEPEAFSIHDLESAVDQITPWDGVRNYQARNYMRDQMKVGDRVLYYHSNADPSGVAGLAEVASQPYPDPTAFDPSSPYYDPKSTASSPTWILVDVRWVATFPQLIPLSVLKEQSQLTGMELLRRGSRLSVQPVSKAHYDWIVKLSKKLK